MIKKTLMVLMCTFIGTIQAAESESLKEIVIKIAKMPASEIHLPTIDIDVDKPARTFFAWNSTSTELAKEYSPSSKRTITIPGGKETVVKAIIVHQKKETVPTLTNTYIPTLTNTYIITDTGDCFKQKPKKVEKVHEERTSHTSTLSYSWILCGCC